MEWWQRQGHLADWSMFRDREVYMYPDDDEPGRRPRRKYASNYRPCAWPYPYRPHVKSNPGADIVEALQVMDASALAAYIMESPGVEPGNPPRTPPPESHPRPDPAPLPAISAMPRSAFWARPMTATPISSTARADRRLETRRPERAQTQRAGTLEYWQSNYTVYDDKGRGRMSWTWALDTITRYAQARAYDPTNVRCRGCWRERDGRSVITTANTRWRCRHAQDIPEKNTC
jgi:hypothetical protein